MTKQVYFAKNNAHFNFGQPFVLGSEQYPAEWLENSSDEWLEENGLVLVTEVNNLEGDAANESLSIITSNLEGPHRVWYSTPRDPAALLKAKEDGVEAKKAQIRVVRELYLGRILGIKDAARDDEDTATVEACKLVRQALLDITNDLPTEPSEVDMAVMVKYFAIKQMCTPQLDKAFNDMNT